MIIIFGLIAILVYAALIYYIARSVWSWIGQGKLQGWRWPYQIIVVLISLSIIVARIFPNSRILAYLSAYWLASFALLLLILPCIHIVKWILRFTKLSRHKVHCFMGWVTLVLFVGLFAVGSYLAYSPVVRNYDITIHKKSPGLESLNIVFAADTHFGYVSGPDHAKRLVQMINDLKPDLVLIPGDVIDDQVGPFTEQGMDKILGGIVAKYGVYASLGNHDTYLGEMSDLIQVIEGAGMHVLYDESVTVMNGLTLIGRKDASDSTRLPIGGLIAGLDPANTQILLDHQPSDLEAEAKHDIDLVLSGHTHRGQVFPGQYITDLIYENDWGYLLKGKLQSIVTSGYGFWGLPIRLGSRSELVQIHLHWAP